MSQCLGSLENWKIWLHGINEGLKLSISSSKKVFSSSPHPPTLLLMTDPDAKSPSVAIYYHACAMGLPTVGKNFLCQYLSEKLKNKRLTKSTHCFFFFLMPGVNKHFLQRANSKHFRLYHSYCLCYDYSTLQS